MYFWASKNHRKVSLRVSLFQAVDSKKEILLHITIIFVNCILYKVKVLGIVVRLESLLSTAYIIMWTKRRTFSCCIFSGNITWFLVSIDNYIGVRERIIFFLLHIDNIVSKFFKHCLIWVISGYLVNFMIAWVQISWIHTYNLTYNRFLSSKWP